MKGYKKSEIDSAMAKWQELLRTHGQGSGNPITIKEVLKNHIEANFTGTPFTLAEAVGHILKHMLGIVTPPQDVTSYGEDFANHGEIYALVCFRVSKFSLELLNDKLYFDGKTYRWKQQNAANNDNNNNNNNAANSAVKTMRGTRYRPNTPAMPLRKRKPGKRTVSDDENFDVSGTDNNNNNNNNASHPFASKKPKNGRFFAPTVTSAAEVKLDNNNRQFNFTPAIFDELDEVDQATALMLSMKRSNK